VIPDKVKSGKLGNGVYRNFGIVFLIISIFFFILPWITYISKLTLIQPFYIYIILSTLSFIFAYLLLYTAPYADQKRILKDKKIEKQISEIEQDIAEAKRDKVKAESETTGQQKALNEEKQRKNNTHNLDEYKFKENYYPTAIKLLENEVCFNWQRLSCFLITNSIVFAAWAIILAEMSYPPKTLLILIGLLGLVFSILWRSAAIRGNKFHFFWLEKLRKFEEDKIPEPEYRIFIPFEDLTKGRRVKFRREEIELKGLARLGVGRFFVLLSEVFLWIYFLITVYSFSIPSLPWLFPN